jgi:hypothetical protein
MVHLVCVTKPLSAALSIGAHSWPPNAEIARRPSNPVFASNSVITALGPSRHIAAPREFGRERCIAEVEAGPSIAEGGAHDPSLK